MPMHQNEQVSTVVGLMERAAKSTIPAPIEHHDPGDETDFPDHMDQLEEPTFEQLVEFDIRELLDRTERLAQGLANLAVAFVAHRDQPTLRARMAAWFREHGYSGPR